MFASLGAAVGSAPVGAALWQDTTVDASMLPSGAVLTDLLTGARFESFDGRLDLGRIFHYFPGTILHYDMQAR
jgi:hypothetical protein